MEKVKLTSELVGNMGFKMNLNGHELIMDASEDIGGNNQGPRPKQLLLAGLIGCTGIDVMSILNKMRIEIDNLHIDVETNHTDEHPKVYEDIHLIYRFKGDNLNEERIERAVKLSQEKYCGVTKMLSNHTPVTYEIIYE